LRKTKSPAQGAEISYSFLFFLLLKIHRSVQCYVFSVTILIVDLDMFCVFVIRTWFRHRSSFSENSQSNTSESARLKCFEKVDQGQCKIRLFPGRFLSFEERSPLICVRTSVLSFCNNTGPRRLTLKETANSASRASPYLLKTKAESTSRDTYQFDRVLSVETHSDRSSNPLPWECVLTETGSEHRTIQDGPELHRGRTILGNLNTPCSPPADR